MLAHVASSGVEQSPQGGHYWGEPFKVFWFAQPDALYARLVEYTPIGWPAYAACMKFEFDGSKFTLANLAEPGRDSPCPDWAKPLEEALRQ